MTFKNKFLNDIKKAYDVYQTTLKGLDIQSQALYERYSTKIADEKNAELQQKREMAKEKYLNAVKEGYDSALKPLQEQYDKALSGGAITDDVKLFTTDGLYLSRNEIQAIANRYKDNYIMNRIIKDYVEKHNIPMVGVGSTEPQGLDKMQVLENAKEMATNMFEKPHMFDIVVNDGFRKFDSML